MKLILVFIGLTFSLLLGGCDSSSKDNKLTAVCTTSIVSDLVSQVVGDKINVISLMGPGVDPHLYQAKESDVRVISSADIVFYNGLFLEAKLEDVIEKIGSKKPVVALASSVAEAQLIPSQDYENMYDPHIWFDVMLWSQTLTAVLDALIELDPANQSFYQKRVYEYQKQLTSLDQWVKAQISLIPRKQRVLVSAHDAFGYFGRKYDFNVKALQGISTESQPGTKDIQQLASYVSSEKIPAIFIETSVPERTIKSVQDAVIAKGWNVVIGDSLYTDALGAPKSSQGTYIGMIRHNVDSIVKGLSAND